MISLTVDKYVSGFVQNADLANRRTSVCVSFLTSILYKVDQSCRQPMDVGHAVPVFLRNLEPFMEIAESTCPLPA